MNETPTSNFPEPRRIGVWTEGAPVETRLVEFREGFPYQYDNIVFM